MRTLIFLTIASLFLLSGCTSSVTKTTDKGFFHIGLISKGRILKLGRNEVEIKVIDDKGVGVEGAKIEITPWMPEHGHGTQWPPTVTEKGRGIYRSVIPLIMIGHWELKIIVRKGNVVDSVIFDFPGVYK